MNEIHRLRCTTRSRQFVKKTLHSHSLTHTYQLLLCANDELETTPTKMFTGFKPKNLCGGGDADRLRGVEPVEARHRRVEARCREC